ncbi:MAG: TIGR02530 family flagellar biosynthesis protein [Clostridiaceae bacterium]|nr:TIGR02530 family flagellar biosynthesis protein [Clostridiaceae bacterium]
MRLDQLQGGYSSIAAAAQNIRPAETETGGRSGENNAGSFDAILKDAVSKREAPTFSRHAGARMLQRDICLSQAEMTKLTDAVGRAEYKGVKNTLVLMDQMAFIVNVPDNVVITAMNGQDLKENVFTQIDGAVIA